LPDPPRQERSRGRHTLHVQDGWVLPVTARCPLRGSHGLTNGSHPPGPLAVRPVGRIPADRPARPRTRCRVRAGRAREVAYRSPQPPTILRPHVGLAPVSPGQDSPTAHPDA
jgi:hypothetical protein